MVLVPVVLVPAVVVVFVVDIAKRFWCGCWNADVLERSRPLWYDTPRISSGDNNDGLRLVNTDRI